MNNQKQIRKYSELSPLKLSGIEFVQSLTGPNGSDFASITIKDTKTGTLITMSRGPYSDMVIHATLPVKTEKRFVVVSIEQDGEFRSKPLKAEELDAVKDQHPGCQVEELDVPVEE